MYRNRAGDFIKSKKTEIQDDMLTVKKIFEGYDNDAIELVILQHVSCCLEWYCYSNTWLQNFMTTSS